MVLLKNILISYLYEITVKNICIDNILTSSVYTDRNQNRFQLYHSPNQVTQTFIEIPKILKFQYLFVSKNCYLGTFYSSSCDIIAILLIGESVWFIYQTFSVWLACKVTSTSTSETTLFLSLYDGHDAILLKKEVNLHSDMANISEPGLTVFNFDRGFSTLHMVSEVIVISYHYILFFPNTKLALGNCWQQV